MECYIEAECFIFKNDDIEISIAFGVSKDELMKPEDDLKNFIESFCNNENCLMRFVGFDSFFIVSNDSEDGIVEIETGSAKHFVLSASVIHVSYSIFKPAFIIFLDKLTNLIEYSESDEDD